MNIQIELTNLCSLSCRECPNHLMTRNREFMSRRTFDIILQNYIIPINPNTLIMHKDGESLLHPNYYEIIQDIRKAGVEAKIDIYTNGLHLKKELVAGLGNLGGSYRILISFHHYNYNGKKNNYNDAIEEIRQCLELRLDNIEFVFTTHEIDIIDKKELDNWKKYWEEVKSIYKSVTGVHVNTSINPWTGLVQNINMATFDTCPYADFGHLFFGVTGNILACCMDLEEELVFGNVHVSSKDVVMEKLLNFYKKTSNKELSNLCKRCLNHE